MSEVFVVILTQFDTEDGTLILEQRNLSIFSYFVRVEMENFAFLI